MLLEEQYVKKNSCLSKFNIQTKIQNSYHFIYGGKIQNSTLYIQFINFPPTNKKASTLRTYEVLASNHLVVLSFLDELRFGISKNIRI